ncbi:hypothetical protein Mal64_19180 [Pseudobythopirellula maris]|uniref:NfeD-like C-terminal domain-containing protein n=1 Tax=Pseudobythopirellula maris TaxID=2527991 RepID=A0A5C5ZNE2_9BACT|nr:hypothetical protein [Pseudobythopirellula maris]TWT88437.1 hypothetical protein Mal64_19180 [Pseudobythopirellula maris]
MLDELFFWCAIGGGAALLLQTLPMLLGMEGADDAIDGPFDGADADLDGGDASGFWLFEMISLRTVTAAVTFFGLAGKACSTSGLNSGVSLAVALAAGYAAMYSVYWAFKQVFKLETSGNLDIRGAVGLTGQVYVPIDPPRAGKIHLMLQGRTVEYQAVTAGDARLATGEKIVVTDIVSSDTVEVAAIAAEAPSQNPVATG